MKKVVTLAMTLLMGIVSQTLSAQDLNDIVTRHIEAIGGYENWTKVKSLKTNMQMNAQGAEVKITIYSLHKKGMRVEVDAMGMNGYQIITDKEGWSYMPFQGQEKPEPATEEDVKSSQDELDLMDDFMTYKDYGKKLEFLGSDDVEGTDCYKLSMTDKAGKITTFYMDKSNFYVIKETTKKSVNGKELEMNITYGNYRALPEGIVVAMSQGGDMGAMETTDVAVNSNITEIIFQPKPLKDLLK